MADNKNILIVAETDAGGPIQLVFELLGLGRRLAAETGGAVCVVAPHDAASRLPPQLIERGADRVFVLPPGQVDCYQSDVWLAAMGDVIAQATPGTILIGHTALGADLAPRLAFRLKAAIATGCEKVEADGERLRVTRPCFGNKAREILCLVSRPAVATVKTKMHDVPAPDAQRSGEVVQLAAASTASPSSSRVVERKREDASAGVRLENAKVIVGGGRGLGGTEGFKVLQELAAVLGGAVGASRVACDLGWCPHSWQIGLTGKTITPDLYIAVGISGASHHMAGCGNAKAILAINSDSDAAIFKEARYGVVGDYREIVPALVEEMSKRKA